jgi:hypothetical protein
VQLGSKSDLAFWLRTWPSQNKLICICDELGVEQLRLPDIPVQSGASNVVYQESITFTKAMPTSKMIARLITFDESGVVRLLDEYTFNHTSSLAGPGAW